MTTNRPHVRRSSQKATARARSSRKNQTRSEGLLWSVLRANQLCGLRFRRQHPIGPWITDFACPEKRFVVEIDGGYHDATVAEDIRRQEHLQQHGWTVIRFSDKDVEEDVEVVLRAIARELGLPYEFKRRQGGGSGMKSVNATGRNAPKKR
jgi:very-short-patch-repair endonuclease